MTSASLGPAGLSASRNHSAIGLEVLGVMVQELVMLDDLPWICKVARLVAEGEGGTEQETKFLLLFAEAHGARGSVVIRVKR